MVWHPILFDLVASTIYCKVDVASSISSKEQVTVPISFISSSFPHYIYIYIYICICPHIKRKDRERGWHPILLVLVTLHNSCKLEVASPISSKEEVRGHAHLL